MNVDHPYRVDGRGRTAQTGDDDHVRDLIEQVLFTSPGERVNRPGFGSGVLQLPFAPNSEALAAAAQLTVQASLQEWLGDLIELKAVEVDRRDSTLAVAVSYVLRRTRAERTDVFTTGGPA